MTLVDPALTLPTALARLLGPRRDLRQVLSETDSQLVMIGRGTIARILNVLDDLDPDPELDVFPANWMASGVKA